MPTTTLSLLARDLLLQAQARIEAAPSLTLWLAAFQAHHAPFPSAALDEVAALPAELLELSGAEACDEITSLLKTSAFPVEATIPAPAPTVEVPSDDARLRAAGVLGQASDSLEHARLLLGAAHEGELISLQNQIEALSRELLACFPFLTAEAAE